MNRPGGLQYHADAADEVNAALQWYLARCSVAAAAFVQEVEHAVERILEAPLRWPRRGRKIRRYLLPSFPFSVVYCVRGDLVEVLAAAHHRRRPGYWKSRGK